MKRMALRPRERRILFLGGGIVGSLLLFGKVIPTLLSWQRDTIAGAAELIAEAARAEMVIGAFAELQDSVVSRGQRLVSVGERLVGGETPTVAAGALASMVSRVASDANVQLGALQVNIDSTGAGLFVRVAVRTSATGDVSGISYLLNALERGPKLVAIRELSISQPDPGAADDKPEALRAELLVEALALPEHKGEP